MPERFKFIQATIQEVLGPREGATEVIEFRPDDDGGYITGWLAPCPPSEGEPEEGENELQPLVEEIGSTDVTGAGHVETALELETPGEGEVVESSSVEDQDAGPAVAGRKDHQSLPSLEPGRMPSIMGDLLHGDRTSDSHGDMCHLVQV